MIICGIDEAGRGPLAGPVTAAAVILPTDFPFEILNDSKKLSEKKRIYAANVIKSHSVSWGLGWVWQKKIDKINILQASLLAMQYAFESMCAKNQHSCPDCVIIDGTFVPNILAHCVAKPKADSSEHSVMAASILAKTARDNVMCRLAKHFPQYGYEKHKGYPTKAHMEICRSLGNSPIQRLSFKY